MTFYFFITDKKLELFLTKSNSYVYCNKKPPETNTSGGFLF